LVMNGFGIILATAKLEKEKCYGNYNNR